MENNLDDICVFAVPDDFTLSTHLELIKQCRNCLAEELPALAVEFFYFIQAGCRDRYLIVRISGDSAPEVVETAFAELADNLRLPRLSRRAAARFFRDAPPLDDYG